MKSEALDHLVDLEHFLLANNPSAHFLTARLDEFIEEMKKHPTLEPGATDEGFQIEDGTIGAKLAHKRKEYMKSPEREVHLPNNSSPKRRARTGPGDKTMAPQK